MLLIDLQKSYDSVDRQKLLNIIDSRARTESDKRISHLIRMLHENNEIMVGQEMINLNFGIAQGSVLAPYLFNIYLEEALNSCDVFKELIVRKDLLAYADDITMFTKNDMEIGRVVQGFRQMEQLFNMRINLKKCEILRIKGGNNNIKQIEGIEVKDNVKYLGMRLVADRQQQKREVDQQIRRNLGFLKWKLRFADSMVMETLINSFGRSLLIYLGTPMVAG